MMFPCHEVHGGNQLNKFPLDYTLDMVQGGKPRSSDLPDHMNHLKQGPGGSQAPETVTEAGWVALASI